MNKKKFNTETLESLIKDCTDAEKIYETNLIKTYNMLSDVRNKKILLKNIKENIKSG